MARKSDTAPADPIDATVATHIERDGVQYPALLIQGEAPRRGSTLTVRLVNGILYTAKVHAVTEGDGDGHLVETDGLVAVDE